MKQFIAISTETLDNKLVYINTSSGEALHNENGIDFESAIEFLFNLIYKREHRKQKTVFISYGFTRDNEFIFSTMSKEMKDKLFQSHIVKHKLNKLEFEQEKLDEQYFKYRLKDSIDGWFVRPDLTDDEKDELELADFNKYVNYLAQQELIEVKFNGFNISLANGKRLTIRKNNKSISIYDIYGFFKSDSLRDSCAKWLGRNIAILDRNIDFSNGGKMANDFNLSRIRSSVEVKAIADLATKLDAELSAIGCNLSRYHGATAVTSWLLTKSKAKDYFHSYRYKRQASGEFNKAVMQSYYGGRAEQFKIGTIKNVYIYDINSAYAFASSFLPVLLHKPRFVREYDEQPFSIWFVEYNFKNIGSYFGYLPNRANSNSTQYKVSGKGYFWFPEVQFLLQNFPECIKITRGFVWDYQTAPFTEHITAMYDLRLQLQHNGNPLEKVIKKALQSIYGKFCQHQGKGHFYNMSYAGFICSFVRRMLLDATFGKENATICFLTDAIHTTAELPISVSNQLGDYKQEFYEKVEYLDNGVYRCWNDGKVIKTKHKGSKTFDFDAALNDLNAKQYYKADNSIFIGHNIFSLNQFQNADYLHNVKLDKEINPLENVPRIFENKLDKDLTSGFLDSRIIDLYGGRESLLYKQNENNFNDFSLDTIQARTI